MWYVQLQKGRQPMFWITNMLVDIAMSPNILVTQNIGWRPFATAHTTPRSPRQENDTTAKNPDIVQLLLKTRLFDSNHPHSTSQVLPSRRPPRRRLVVHNDAQHSMHKLTQT